MFSSERQLDLNSDEDLDTILNQFHLTGVQSVSECNINPNTSIVCLELQNRNFKRFVRHDHMFFFTRQNPPSYYIDRCEFLEGTQDNIMVPDNNQLKTKLKVHIPRLGIMTTKIVLNRIFAFLFNELFETIIGKTGENGDGEGEEDIRVVDRKLEQHSDYEEESDTSSTSSGMSWYSYCKKHGLPTKQKDIL